jgi:uncharacterized DUF497 family protein
MNDDQFEWDHDKAARNLAEHGVSFEAARRAFDDPFQIEWLDERHDEVRFNLIGMVENRLLFVTYTIRDGRTRIISARGAEPYERRRYHEENS